MESISSHLSAIYPSGFFILVVGSTIFPDAWAQNLSNTSDACLPLFQILKHRLSFLFIMFLEYKSSLSGMRRSFVQVPFCLMLGDSGSLLLLISQPQALQAPARGRGDKRPENKSTIGTCRPTMVGGASDLLQEHSVVFGK